MRGEGREPRSNYHKTKITNNDFFKNALQDAHLLSEESLPPNKSLVWPLGPQYFCRRPQSHLKHLQENSVPKLLLFIG
jgi:hypothetical protein